MMYVEFLNHVIDDGIEAARHDYARPNQQQKRDGSIKGFEECRNLEPEALGELLVEAHKTTMQKHRDEAVDYWFWRCRAAEIEWVCNVISAMLYNEKKPIIIIPTARGTMKAAEIIGVA